MTRPRAARPAAALALLLACAASAAPRGPGATTLDGDGECRHPAGQIAGTPWALQRILLPQLWRYGRGAGVRVAVVDTGVDDRNPQLARALDTRDGADLLDPGGDGTDDTVGHGTEVAGIIAARPAPGTGLVGIAPQATVIPIRQNDEHGRGTVAGLADAVRRATDAGARVVNISQDTAGPPSTGLAHAVRYALAHDVVVVASAGNGGADGLRRTTYPAAYPGVLAVGASDRAGKRAAFSQPGSFVGVLAPGVDMVTTVPVGGQCADSGTSFSAPYVSGVAVLLRARHPSWTARQVVDRIERTAVRDTAGRDDYRGWGVVDPVRALGDDAGPAARPPAEGGVRPAGSTVAAAVHRRSVRVTLAYALVGAVLLAALAAGGAVALRDARRRRG